MGLGQSMIHVTGSVHDTWDWVSPWHMGLGQSMIHGTRWVHDTWDWVSPWYMGLGQPMTHGTGSRQSMIHGTGSLPWAESWYSAAAVRIYSEQQQGEFTVSSCSEPLQRAAAVSSYSEQLQWPVTASSWSEFSRLFEIVAFFEIFHKSIQAITYATNCTITYYICYKLHYNILRMLHTAL